MGDTRAEAHRLHRLGLPITLCPPGKKQPLGEGWDAERNGRGWQKKRWTHKDIDRAFKVRGQLNVGVRFGASSKIIDIENDSPASLAALADLFDGCPPPVTPTFTSPRGTHRIFAWDPSLEATGKAILVFHGLEIRIGAGGKAAHSLFPPSVTDGVEREWRVSLDDCKPQALPQLAVKRIIEANKCLVIDPHPSSVESAHRTLLVSTVSSVCQEPATADIRELVQKAIKGTLPTGEGHRNRCIFNLVRRLKGIPALADAAWGDLRQYVEWWHELALPKIATKAFEETWYDFRKGWENVRIPAGEGPVVDAFTRAIAKPSPPCAEKYEGQKLRALVALCRELQRISGDGPFYLACRVVANLLDIEHSLAARWLRMLCMDEVLRLVKRGTLHRASEYLYCGD